MPDNEKTITQAYHDVFHTEAGRKVLAHLEDITNVHRSHFIGGKEIDKDTLVYDESRRSLVLGIRYRSEKCISDPQEQSTAITEGATANG